MKLKGPAVSGNLVVGYSSSLKLRVLGIVLLFSSLQVCSDVPTDSTTTGPRTVQPQCRINEPRILRHPETVLDAIKGGNVNVTFKCRTCDLLTWSVRNADGVEVYHDSKSFSIEDGNVIHSSVLTVYSVDSDKDGWQVRCYAGVNLEVESQVAFLYLLPTLEETTAANNETSTGSASGQSLNNPSTFADRTARNIAIGAPFVLVVLLSLLCAVCVWHLIKRQRTRHMSNPVHTIRVVSSTSKPKVLFELDLPQPKEDSKGIVECDTTMAQPTDGVEMHPTTGEADTVTETGLDTVEPRPRRRSPGNSYSRDAPADCVAVPMEGDPLMEQSVNVKSDRELVEKPHIDIQSANSTSPNGEHGTSLQETSEDIEGNDGSTKVIATSKCLILVPRNASSVSLSSLPGNKIPPQESHELSEDQEPACV